MSISLFLITAAAFIFSACARTDDEAAVVDAGIDTSADVSNDVAEYARLGVFVPIAEWVHNPEIAVNVWGMDPEDREFVIRNITMADGEIYTVPGFNRVVWNEGPHRAWINHEWLSALNLEMPATTDEFREVRMLL